MPRPGPHCTGVRGSVVVCRRDNIRGAGMGVPEGHIVWQKVIPRRPAGGGRRRPVSGALARAESARGCDIDSPGANFVKEVKKDSTCAI